MAGSQFPRRPVYQDLGQTWDRFFMPYLTAAPENGWSCGCFQDWSPPDRFSSMVRIRGAYPFITYNMR
jgi:hypothetical protein